MSGSFKIRKPRLTYAGIRKGITCARWALAASAVVIIGIMCVDYLTPATLEVDLNAPRFRLVRHRMLFPSSELEMEWKHMGQWDKPASESAPIFGERTLGGVYAWEADRRRFEGLGDVATDESDRTNYGSFAIDTDFLPHERAPRSRAQWLASRVHQPSLSVSEQELAIDDAARDSALKEFDAKYGTNFRLEIQTSQAKFRAALQAALRDAAQTNGVPWQK